MTKFIKKFIAAAVFTIASSAMLKAGDDFFVYVSPDPIGVNAFLEMGKSGIEAAASIPLLPISKNAFTPIGSGET